MTSFLESVQETIPKEGLRQAFELFNEMSQQLTESYEKLEGQVHVLSGELAEVSAARMKELKEKEQIADRLDRLLQLLPGGVVVLDGNGRIQDINRAASFMFEQKNIKGELWREIIKAHFSPREDDGHEISLRNGKRLSIQTSGLDREPGQIILMTDQTETRELQAKLSRHQRLMAMGNMVASLAHQVRTPLSGAMLYAQHLSDGNLEQQTRTIFSKKLSRQLKNIEAQVRDMLIFAKGSAPLNKILSQHELLELITESKQLLSKQYQAEIFIENYAS
ncbi:MAG: two-component system sensor histidine kinase FlrB, partial [Bermanella sp.]